jgi:hypothetical protein
VLRLDAALQGFAGEGETGENVSRGDSQRFWTADETTNQNVFSAVFPATMFQGSSRIPMIQRLQPVETTNDRH